ncbi:MAG: hypothetical protein ACFE0I_21960 [Elainellaceae cyanobacterium]
MYRVESGLFDAQAKLQHVTQTQQTVTLLEYEQDLKAIKDEVEALKAMTADDPIQQQNLQDLDNSLKTEFQRISASQREAYDASDSLFQTSILWQQISRIRQHEKTLLDERRARVDRSGFVATGIVCLGMAIAGYMSWLTHREQRHQEQIRADLTKRLYG